MKMTKEPPARTRPANVTTQLTLALSVIGSFVSAQSDKLYGIVFRVVTGLFADLQAKAESES